MGTKGLVSQKCIFLISLLTDFPFLCPPNNVTQEVKRVNTIDKMPEIK